MTGVILETERLLLRYFDLKDAEFILRLLNSPDWIKYIGDRNIRTIADAERQIANVYQKLYQLHGFGMCAVCLKETHMPVGMGGLLKRDNLPYPDVGYALLPEYCGQGYATEITKAVINYYSKKLNLNRVLAITVTGNKASVHVLQKCGMHFEKIMNMPDDSDELMLFAIDLK